MITYEGLGLCAEGEATKFIAGGDNIHGGKFVVNPSGGLMSKGHPLALLVWLSVMSWLISYVVILVFVKLKVPELGCSITWL